MDDITVADNEDDYDDADYDQYEYFDDDIGGFPALLT